MATILIITVFIVGYLAIALEHSVNINKAATDDTEKDGFNPFLIRLISG